MLKNRIAFFAMGCAGLLCMTAVAQPSSDGGHYAGFETGVSMWGISNNIRSITGIPASFRTMPTNPDDVATGWGNAIYTITPDSVQPRTTVAGSVFFAPVFRLGRGWTLRFGVNVTVGGLSPYAAPAFDSNNKLVPRSATNEVNVGSGLPLGRGVGTSLVYYTATTGWSLIPGGSVGLEKHVARGYSVVLDSRVVSYRNTIEEGWDRYNSFTEYQRHTLGTTFLAGELIGLRIGGPTGVVVAAGPAISFADISSSAPGAAVNFTKAGLMLETTWFVRKGRDAAK